MNQRKQNMSRWYILGLAVMLTMGCLVMSVGVTWARYRTEADKLILFQPRTPLRVCLGTMVPGEDDTSVFTQTDQAVWTVANGRTQLDFAVANGASAEDFEPGTQRFHIRLVGSLGAWSGEDNAAIRIRKPGPEEQTDTAQPAADPGVAATAGRIPPATQLYQAFGDGWIFRFLDEGSGEELTWTLEGGRLSCLELSIVIDGGTLVDTSLLQLQIVNAFSGE